MRPILLKGHERSITKVLYNRDGDLIFTASKDSVPSVWYSENGERIGTYHGHVGAVWDLDCSWDSTRLLSGSADATVKMWDVETGVETCTFNHKGPVRSVRWAEGCQAFVSVSDPFMESPPFVSVYDCPDDADPEQIEKIPRLEIQLDKKSTGGAHFIKENKEILVAMEDGSIRIYDAETGEQIHQVKHHTQKIQTVFFNKERSLMLTGSADTWSKLIDLDNMEVIKQYKTDRPVNAVAISPDKDHVLMGGGQDAMSVTTTGSKAGKFETRFYHAIAEEEFGRVKGHFGPVNALGVDPRGRGFASGAEDGYVRLHHYDQEYLDKTDPVPEDFEEGEVDSEEEEEGEN
uniref:Eukaryotic translation initiation factor 3 subunit I n=1 Tax=Heterosigma akashiwo TaxID=2829 RepID=A0A6V2RRW4_HETAK|mmetsp:Transcript_2565/g.3723  ORF Transcript_2565/g.3723 Transcript_2565/m.3723 type:complete len:347 (+) Transcript_2565:92-1132(+)|eukprot:CAMPEP_0194577624 /NCGR_PEP_ID=MMETSP0292-20121207/12338_1 /TAXON_ID=39354 /ORGANISM="Heterosigma akashiwo, Strain CCMP2393" /LENGTH=346 /DNA_ID=CAMNT_0039430057 /DNA_START=48 /DNA_END=1088 /DNA_ORIENTATION=-